MVWTNAFQSSPARGGEGTPESAAIGSGASAMWSRRRCADAGPMPGIRCINRKPATRSRGFSTKRSSASMSLMWAESLSKPLVMPETAGSRHIDYRISMYQPMAHVARHKHLVQEQVYHVLEGEGLMEIAGKNHVVRKHDFIFLPPGVEHAISNSGLVDLVFLVVTSPVTDDEKPV